MSNEISSWAGAMLSLTPSQVDQPEVRGEKSPHLKHAVHYSSIKVEWPTPKALYEALDEEFHFDFDPCPIDGSFDGLAKLFTPWSGKRVFCNPPYGAGISKWLERAGEAKVAVYLLPVRTDTKWFHELVLPKADEIRFVRRRVRFQGASQDAPFPSMLVIYR